jgi:hypothetical protein
VVGVPAGGGQLVQHQHHRAPGPSQVVDELEHLQLVAEVQRGGRLVQQHHLGLLGDDHRDPGPLALPAGEGVQRPVGELEQVRRGQRLGDGRGVLR